MQRLGYLFGFTGTSLTDGAVDPAGNRTDPAEISAFLGDFLPGAGGASSVPASAETGVADSDAREWFFAGLGNSVEEDEEADDPLAGDLPIVLCYDPA